MKKKMFCLGILFLFACDLSLNAQQTMSVIPPIVHDYATAIKDFPVVDVHRECATIRYDSHDYKGVIRAINDLHKRHRTRDRCKNQCICRCRFREVRNHNRNVRKKARL